MSEQPPPYAEYPRPSSPSSNGHGRGPGVYFESIGEAWALVLKDPGHWIAATIVYIAVGWALTHPIDLLIEGYMPSRPTFDQLGLVFGLRGLQMIANVVPFAIHNILLVGMVSMGIRKSRGEYINVGMMFEPFRHFGRSLAANTLNMVIVIASLLACLVPALFFIPVLILMPVVAYQKNLGAVDALALTFDTCKPHWAGLLALMILLGLVSVAGLCACIIGLGIALPMYCVVLGIHYRAFFESASEVPPTYPQY